VKPQAVFEPDSDLAQGILASFVALPQEGLGRQMALAMNLALETSHAPKWESSNHEYWWTREVCVWLAPKLGIHIGELIQRHESPFGPGAGASLSEEVWLLVQHPEVLLQEIHSG